VKRSIEEEYEKAMKTANLYQSLLSTVWEITLLVILVPLSTHL
jgi:hypothetical protein